MAKRLRTLALFLAFVLAGCGSDTITNEVTIRVEVTSTPSGVSFDGELSSLAQDEILFAGTTPFSQDFSDRRLPVDVAVRQTGGPAAVITLCALNVRSGTQECQSTSSGEVDVDL